MSGIWLSKTSTPPYTTIAGLSDALTIEKTADFESISTIGLLYIVMDHVQYSNVQLRVEGETTLGTSLTISLLDIIGEPTHWGKLIELENINTPEGIQTIPIKYKWTAINNIYILKTFKSTGNINIYNME